MKRQKTFKLYAAIALLGAATLACALPGGEEDAGDAGVSQVDEASNEDESGDTSSPVEGPRVTDPEADAACVVGTWAVDTSSMTDYLEANLNQGEDDFFEVGEVSGALVMDLSADGVMTLSSDEFTVTVSFNPGVADLALDFTFIYEASGTAKYAAEAGTLRSWDQDWNVEETSLEFNPSITAEGGTFTFEFNPGMFMEVESEEDASVNYDCSGDTLTFFVTDAGEVLFTRMD